MNDRNDQRLRALLLSLVPQDGSTVGNKRLRDVFAKAAQQGGLAVGDAEYDAAREALLSQGLLLKGRGRGGSVFRAPDPPPSFQLAAQEGPPPDLFVPPNSTTRRASAHGKRGTGKRPSGNGQAEVLSYRHTDKRKNNPPVGLVSPESDPGEGKTRWQYDPHLDPELRFDVGRAGIERLIDDALASGDTEVMRTALEELKHLQSPYLTWTGKAERTSFEVDTVSLHVHERIDPATILASVRKRLKSGRDPGLQPDLFAAPFENLPLREAFDFYRHERGWSNRLIAGDSLLVMNSLLQKEGMAGQVQMIYIDPPYGIRYGSNFQPFTNKRDVKDRNDQDLTQEPEMIKAFRDTWELGIHSYLTYLRDRLLLSRDLLNVSGSVFVQISDENLHHVKEIMDEVFGSENFCAIITVAKTAGQTAQLLAGVSDYLIWYSRSRTSVKYRKVLLEKSLETDRAGVYRWVLTPELATRRLRDGDDASELGVFRIDNLTSQRPPGDFPVDFRGTSYGPGRGFWKTSQQGMTRLSRASRIIQSGSSLAYRRFLSDFAAQEVGNLWTDTGTGSFTEDKVYVVQTAEKVAQRCLLMTTDPGDLVLDPTCGSGTTASMAEKWGRRWITCDTSRVAVTLAKQRLLTASYDYYELRYPHEGLKSGFIYKTVPHVTLKSIANNPEIDEIRARMHPALQSCLAELNDALAASPPSEPFEVTEGARKGESLFFSKRERLDEWEVPFDWPQAWPDGAKSAFDRFHEARIAMQKAMDASIAAHAEHETLFDRPEISKTKRRISGPFTVEAVPFPSVVALDESKPADEADTAIARSGESARQHQWRDELLCTGIRGKGGQKLMLADLEALPDTRHLHASGTMADSGERVVVSFGPQHAALEQRQVALALNEAEKLRPAPKFVIFCAFTFDPEAAKDIDETRWPGVTLLKAQMNTDLLTEDLKKARPSNQSFWLMGQPEVELRGCSDGRFEVEVHGFDYFDTARGELVSGGKKKIAMWLLDTDYDERSLLPRQVFFPMAGAKDGWYKLRRNIRAELNEPLLKKFHGTVSLPFERGENGKVAVKVVDDRGIESLRILEIAS